MERKPTKSYSLALREMKRAKPDVAKAEKLLQRALEQGDPEAAYALATWHLHGFHYEQNMRKAVRLLRQAAKANVPSALSDLAVCYEIGAGVVKNPGRAYELHLAAALRGDKDSIYEVGRCHYWGIGVKQNRKVTWIWQDYALESGLLTSDEIEKMEKNRMPLSILRKYSAPDRKARKKSAPRSR